MLMRPSFISRFAKAQHRSIRCNSSTEPEADRRPRSLSGSLFGVRHPYPEPSRQILHVLPGDAARAGATGGGPFQRLAGELLAPERNAITGHIGFHHRQIFVLAAAVKTEPEPEAVGQ